MGTAEPSAARDPVAAPRRALLIAGMHRSGTSALTRVLSLLGGALPSELMEPDGGNERGYWESPAISLFDDRLLADAGLAWHSWERMPEGWFAGRRAAAFRDEAAALVRAQFGGGGRPILLKDPRLCRLLPFWREVLETSGMEVAVVVPLRAPAEVGASLRDRNELSADLAQLSWLRHLLDAERHSRDLPRAFVRYDELLDDWRAVATRLGGTIGADWPASAEAEVDAFLAPDLRHFGGEAAPPSPWAEEAWRIVSRWSADGERPGDCDRLDAIAAALDAAEPNFARPIHAYQLERLELHAALKARLDRSAREEELAAELRALVIEKARLEAELVERTAAAEMARLAAALDAAQDNGVDDLRRQLADARYEATAMRYGMRAAQEQARANELLLAEARRVIGAHARDYDRLAHQAELMRRLAAG